MAMTDHLFSIAALMAGGGAFLAGFLVAGRRAAWRTALMRAAWQAERAQLVAQCLTAADEMKRLAMMAEDHAAALSAAETARHADHALLRMLAESAAALLAEGPADTAIATVLAAAGPALGLERFGLWRLEDREGSAHLVPARQWQRPGLAPPAEAVDLAGDGQAVAEGLAGGAAFSPTEKSLPPALKGAVRLIPFSIGGRPGGLLAACGDSGGTGLARWTGLDAAAMLAALMGHALEREEGRVALAAEARSDPLTGLANRAGFSERLHQAFAAARRDGHDRHNGFALFYIDLDRFKEINDRLGHAVGDAVLLEMARRLKALLREADLAARLGGDEFAVIAAGCIRNEDARHLARTMNDALARPCDIDGRRLAVTASIGAAFYTKSFTSPATLLAEAHRAL
jgi:diguanylate cyclase (GGDEF)-like protein